MNCPGCRDRLQQWFDARTRAAASIPGEPPALCPACAEWSAAARRLDCGLRLLAPPIPSPNLTGRILAQVAAERRFRRYRLLVVAGVAATAATLVIAVWQSLHGGIPVPTPAPVPGQVVQTPDSQPSTPRANLRDSMAEAGSAVASLTSRTADETMDKTKILLPVVVDPSLSKIDLQPSLDPSTRSLRQAGEGVSAGLEPVADSARRAVGLFLRELPPMDAAPKTGF
jgi:hypothetical protein